MFQILLRNLFNAFYKCKILADANLEIRKPEVTSFRAVHLLVELFNEVISSLLFFIVVVFEATMIFLVVYGLAGDFNLASKMSLTQLKMEAGSQCHGKLLRKERIYREKLLRSCQVHKIKFGLSNFIEKTTPPVFQLYCLNRMIDLLLVKY